MLESRLTYKSANLRESTLKLKTVNQWVCCILNNSTSDWITDTADSTLPCEKISKQIPFFFRLRVKKENKESKTDNSGQRNFPELNDQSQPIISNLNI